jgi:hypothetical protein
MGEGLLRQSSRGAELAEGLAELAKEFFVGGHARRLRLDGEWDHRVCGPKPPERLLWGAGIALSRHHRLTETKKLSAPPSMKVRPG